MRWMNLEPIIQSEISQKEKDKYCILIYIQNIEKWYRIYLQGRHREQTYEHGQKGGEDEMYGESNIKLTCKIDKQHEFSVCLGKLRQGLCINLGGWGEEGDGREVQKGRDMLTYG